MKLYLHNFWHDNDLSPFFKMFQNVFNENIEMGTIENSDILFESVFGSETLLYKKNWLFSFLFIGESDHRLPIFLKNGMNNARLKDYSCILKGKSENNPNVINFPLFVFYSYSFDFTYKFLCDEKNKITKIPNKNVCVIISNGLGGKLEGRNLFIEELNKKVHIDFAGSYKNNVPQITHSHCSPGFVDFVSNYKVIITMENSKNDNYITEKILHGFAANTIPVYWGADNVDDYFNKDRFINVKSFSVDHIREAIDKIMAVLNNDELFIEVVNKPIYKNNNVPCTLDHISRDIKTLLNIKQVQLKHFITFGGPTRNFHNSVRRICKEAEGLEFFDTIRGFTEADLKQDRIFWEKHGGFIQSNTRGYGYWIWKSYLIRKALEKIKENDILIYCDAGCQINCNGKKRLNEYIDKLNTNKEDHGLISFQLPYPEIQYTKRTVYEKLQISGDNVFQCCATVIIMKKNSHCMTIINEWYKNCEDYSLINDTIHNESRYFIAHRHDQSIYSVVVNNYGSIKIPDETYFSDWEMKGKSYPFWAKRINN